MFNLWSLWLICSTSGSSPPPRAEFTGSPEPLRVNLTNVVGVRPPLGTYRPVRTRLAAAHNRAVTQNVRALAHHDD